MRDNSLVTIQSPFDMATRSIRPVDYDPGRTVGDLVRLANLGAQAVAVVNGALCGDLSRRLRPGDIVHVYPAVQDDVLEVIAPIALAVIGFYVAGPVSGFMQGLGYSEAAASMWGSIATMATITAGGMLLNGMMSTPQVSSDRRASGPDSSPTYGWQASNTAQEGIPIPVVCGNVVTYPQVVNQWLEMDGQDQWSHTLLCVAEGETNNAPTSEEITIDDQPISILPEDSYSVESTDGGASPSALTEFAKLHQLRSIGKELPFAKLSQILLHCNGTNGSTDITDDGVGVANDPVRTGDVQYINTWTAHGNAQLSTAHPFIGTASLDLADTGVRMEWDAGGEQMEWDAGGDTMEWDETGGNSYISVDIPYAMDLWTRNRWDFECRFRQATLANSGIIGQQRIDGATEFYWGIFYDHDNTRLTFQQYRYNGSAYTLYFNISAAASLSVDTWHHVRVARNGTTIYLFLDGTPLGTGTAGTTPAYPASGTWAQAVGKAQHYAAAADAAWYGNCEIDELRLFFYDHLYGLTSYTPPVNALADDNEQTFITKGAVDSFSIIALAPYGMFQVTNSGDWYGWGVYFFISFRKVGASSWERHQRYFGTDSQAVSGATRSPYREQWTFTPTAGRGQYEIRLSRVNISDDDMATGVYADFQFQSTSVWEWLDERLHESLTYPHLQLTAISIKAQEKSSGRIPVFGVESNRTSITVPNYTGVGTRTVNPTNNAHAAFDALTSMVYGPGIAATRIGQTDWEAWEAWCDGTVDGYKRCQINMAFDAEYDLDEAISHIEACGRAKILMRGTQLACVLEKPWSGPAAALFNQANIVPGSSKLRWIRSEEKSDAVEVTYRDITDRTDKAELGKGSGFDALARVPRITRLRLLGINNAEQALREAIFRQQLSESIKRSAEFQSGLEGIPVTTGDVIDWASGGNELTFDGRLARGFAREEEYTGTTVYLDEEITLPSATFSGNCIMLVRDPDDTVQQYTLTGPFDTATRSVVVSAAGTFNFLSPWIILRGTGEIYQYRVNQMARSSRQDVQLTAVQYDADAYYHADYGGGAIAI